MSKPSAAQVLEDFRAILEAMPLARRKELGVRLERVAPLLGVAFEDVRDLFQDRRDGGHEYWILGGVTGEWDAMTLAEAADCLGINQEYLRTRMAVLGNGRWFQPRKTYVPDNGGDRESRSVKRMPKGSMAEHEANKGKQPQPA